MIAILKVLSLLVVLAVYWLWYRFIRRSARRSHTASKYTNLCVDVWGDLEKRNQFTEPEPEEYY
jgi:membrane protein implicated in regulation of membrane protease activity